MPFPRTVGELFEQTWPDPQKIHDIECYLDEWLEAHGGEYPPEREHNFIATGDMLRKAAAAPKPRRRHKPTTAASKAASNRTQLELPL